MIAQPHPHVASRRQAGVGPRRWLAAGVLASAGVVAGGLAVAASTDTPAPATPATTACGDLGDTAPVVDGFPGRLSTLVGADVRTGGHECFERVVLELEGSGDLPGYQVRYEADPILDSPRGGPVEVAGDATLVLSVGAWMTSPEGAGYQGPTEFVPTNVTIIRELQMLENFEGMTAWAIGLDRERDFRVFTLGDPVRIVVDIARDVPGTPPASVPTPPATGAPVPTVGGEIPPTRMWPMPCWSATADPSLTPSCPMGPMGPMSPMGPGPMGPMGPMGPR